MIAPLPVVLGVLLLAAGVRAQEPDVTGSGTDVLVAAFKEAGPEERDAAYEALAGELDPEAIDALLSERAAATVRPLGKGSTLGQLERLARIRLEVDTVREATLEIIFDETRYFAPYKVPEVSPSKAAEYIQVQREIDGLKRDLADLWSEKKKAKLSRGFREALDDLAWTHALQRERNVPTRRRRRRRSEPALEIDTTVALPEGVPEWILGIDASLDKVTLREFAWTPEERDSLALSRVVMTFNALRMARALKAKRDLEGPLRPSKSEIEQVRITNEYRLMLGRCALAWDPRLQAATDHHSRYMSKWGVLSHYEDKDEAHHDFRDRCKLAGYEHGRGENCSMGRADPQGTHDAWCGSSGHHRNLLSAGHTEMASAVAGNYWTQNFGGRPVRAEALDPEADWP